MKKYVAGFVAGACLTLGTTVFADQVKQYILTPASYPIFVNGTEFKDEAAPILNYEGSTYIPLAKMGDLTGVNYKWNEALGRVEINTGAAPEANGNADASSNAASEANGNVNASDNAAIEIIEHVDAYGNLEIDADEYDNGYIINGDGSITNIYRDLAEMESIKRFTEQNKIEIIEP